MIGTHLPDVLQPQPLAGESRRQRLGTLVGQHPAHLLLERHGVAQLPLRGGPRQLLVGHRAPQEERQPRREVEVGDAIRLPGAHRARHLLHAEQEPRAGQDGLHRQAHSRLEVALLAALIVERHQRREVLRADRGAISLGGEPAHDLLRAAALLGLGRRAAREHPPAAQRVGHAGHLHRAGDREVAHVRQRRRAEHFTDVGIRQRVLHRHHQVVNRAVEPRDEGRGHALRARRDVNRRGRHVQPVRILFVHPRVDVDERHALAVHRDVDLLTGVGAAEQVAGGARVQQHLEHVVAVGREDVRHRQAAAGAERGALDVAHLRLRARHLPGGGARRRIRVAQRPDG